MPEKLPISMIKSRRQGKRKRPTLESHFIKASGLQICQFSNRL